MHYKKVKGILSPQNGMNLYRGCTHGCIYCDSRSKCYQINHAFEDIEIKENAIELLEQKLASKRNKCMIRTGAMTDPYIHLESNLKMTRKALETIYKHGFGVSVQTKSTRILEDLDLLKKINNRAKAIVEMTLTTSDEDLCKILEPNVSTTKERVAALKIFNVENIETVVWISPILPFINDTLDNIKDLMNSIIEANVKAIIFFGIGMTLREGNREYYYQKLDAHFPGLKEKYIKTFGNSYECQSPKAKELSNYIIETCKKNDILYNPNEVFQYIATFPKKHKQISLF